MIHATLVLAVWWRPANLELSLKATQGYPYKHLTIKTNSELYLLRRIWLIRSVWQKIALLTSNINTFPLQLHGVGLLLHTVSRFIISLVQLASGNT